MGKIIPSLFCTGQKYYYWGKHMFKTAARDKNFIKPTLLHPALDSPPQSQLGGENQLVFSSHSLIISLCVCGEYKLLCRCGLCYIKETGTILV